MSGRHSNLPQDVANDKRVGERLRQHYKGRFLGGLRHFRALRRKAPGVIAEFVLGALIFAAASLLLFRDLNVVGVLPVAGFCLYFVFVLIVCFWLGGRFWRLLGERVRNGCRYVVANMWTLALSAIILVGTVLQLTSL